MFRRIQRLVFALGIVSVLVLLGVVTAVPAMAYQGHHAHARQAHHEDRDRDREDRRGDRDDNKVPACSVSVSGSVASGVASATFTNKGSAVVGVTATFSSEGGVSRQFPLNPGQLATLTATAVSGPNDVPVLVSADSGHTVCQSFTAHLGNG